MYVLGLDPGALRLGWGIVEVEDGEYSLFASGLFGLKQDDGEKYQDFRKRLIEYWLDTYPRLMEFEPDLVCSEIVPPRSSSGFIGGAVQSDLVKVAMTCIHTQLEHEGVPWQEIASATIRKSVFGMASKPPKPGEKKRRPVTKVDMRNAVSAVFPEILEGRVWEEDLYPDEIDGIATALAGAGYKRARLL